MSNRIPIQDGPLGHTSYTIVSSYSGGNQFQCVCGAQLLTVDSLISHVDFMKLCIRMGLDVESLRCASPKQVSYTEAIDVLLDTEAWRQVSKADQCVALALAILDQVGYSKTVQANVLAVLEKAHRR